MVLEVAAPEALRVFELATELQVLQTLIWLLWQGKLIWVPSDYQQQETFGQGQLFAFVLAVHKVLVP